MRTRLTNPTRSALSSGRGPTVTAAVAVVFIGLLMLAPSAATAQPDTISSIVVERIENGLSVTPDIKFTELDGKSARLAGLCGGWVTDGRLLIGAGGYWLTNRESDFDLMYGGAVVEWFTKLDGPVNFSVRSLFGGGSATLSNDVGTIEIMVRGGRFGRPTTRTIDVGRVRVRDHFIVAEPQANVLFRVNDWFRVGLGAGYRLVGSAGDLSDRLRGFTGTIGFQFGL